MRQDGRNIPLQVVSCPMVHDHHDIECECLCMVHLNQVFCTEINNALLLGECGPNLMHVQSRICRKYNRVSQIEKLIVIAADTPHRNFEEVACCDGSHKAGTRRILPSKRALSPSALSSYLSPYAFHSHLPAPLPLFLPSFHLHTIVTMTGAPFFFFSFPALPH